MADKSQAAQTLQQRIASLSPAQQQLFRKQLEAKGIPWEQAIAASTEKTTAPKKKAPTRPEQLPLSASQKHLLVLHQLYPETTAYHISLVLSMRGALAIPVLKQSLQAIVARHESLRTVFLQGDNQPYAKVLPSLELDFQTVDLTAVPPSEKTEEKAISAASKHHRELLSQQPFDLEKGPLIRARLLRLEDNNFELILVLHHLIADGWSRGILLRELASNYRHYLQQEALQGKTEQPLAPLLTPLKFQYADYVLQQQQWLQGNDYQQQRAYWQEQLSGLPELTLLTDGTAGTDFTSQICTQSFSQDQTLAIKALAKQSGATVFMLLLSIFKLLLQRYSAQRDIAVGIPVAGRNTSAVEEVIGFFVNTLVLRSQIDLNHKFPDWLKQVQATLADAL
ncbi:MAG: condensation domain-containing protein, partial [Cyanobacteria bacterium J06632_3]